ncbi:hypothetical protein RYX36_032454, partial [Vicia faba]
FELNSTQAKLLVPGKRSPAAGRHKMDYRWTKGIVEPIKSGIRDPRLGVGKQEEDDFFTAEENVQRKKLDIELEETEENVRKREV